MRRFPLALLLLTACAQAGAPLWVAVGDAGRRLSSRDGLHWENDQRWPGAASPPLHAVAFGGKQFVAVGGDASAGRILATEDGQAWRELPPLRTAVTAISYGRDRFLAAAGPALFISRDAVTFTPGAELDLHPEAPSLVHTIAIASGDTEAGYRFVLIGSIGRDPGQPEEAWRAVTTEGDRVDQITRGAPAATAVAYGAGHFVLAGSEFLESSHDGQSWTSRPCPGDRFTAIVWTGARFLATAPTAVWSSSDAVTWKRTSNPSQSRILAARDASPAAALAFSPGRVLGVLAADRTWRPLPIDTAIRAVAEGEAPP